MRPSALLPSALLPSALVLVLVLFLVLDPVHSHTPTPPHLHTAAQGPASVTLDGRLQWHPLTLTLDGPRARETDTDPNPFTSYRMTVTFRHESGTPEYRVPGYFAADGRAAETSADSGNKWRAHLSPDKPGRWSYQVAFVRGEGVALDPAAPGERVPGADGLRGSFQVARTDKRGPDFRGKGRLQYVGKHYLRFAEGTRGVGPGEYFLKAGPDSPETFLACADFDGTEARKPAVPLKTWEPHLRDWRPGDPTWKGGKGKGMIGALNYLAAEGLNAFSFMPYNGGGDGDNVWPFAAYSDKRHYDCSKLDQWQIVFEHAQAKGLYLHFKLAEQENDDNLFGQNERRPVPAALDGGDLGPERKLYCRELVARFAHVLALNWNLGEENTQTPEQQRAMAQYLRDLDPYDHPIVVHTFPNWQDRVYPPLLGNQSVLVGASLQNAWNQAHARTHKWVVESAKAGKPWVVASDEQGPADLGVPPDPGYEGFDGKARPQNGTPYDLNDVRKSTLWGNLMAGGAGVEYYFGYRLPQNDLLCQDFRSRARSWAFCRLALAFFRDQKIPFWEMANEDERVGNEQRDNRAYCFSKAGEVYLVYLPNGGSLDLDLSGVSGAFSIRWFNPRAGGPLRSGSIATHPGGCHSSLGQPPANPDQDWVALLRLQPGK